MTTARVLAFFLWVGCAATFGQQPLPTSGVEGADCHDKAHSYWDAPPSFWDKFYKECPPRQVRTLDGEAVYASRGDVRSTVLEHPIPALPRNGEKIGAEVTLAVIVSRTGLVANASVVRSSADKAIDDLALQTVRTWRFRPAR